MAIIVDILCRDAASGLEWPVESSLPLQALPRVGDVLLLDVAAAEWHSFAFTARFVVTAVEHEVTTRHTEEPGRHHTNHSVMLFVEPQDQEAVVVLARVQIEQQDTAGGREDA